MITASDAKKKKLTELMNTNGYREADILNYLNTLNFETASIRTVDEIIVIWMVFNLFAIFEFKRYCETRYSVLQLFNQTHMVTVS